ncbi:MAG: cohesin domain-containing protein [Patescibacteria group bacterium]
MKRNVTIISLFFVVSIFATPYARADHGATLSLSPSAGTFVVGSTFDVTLVLDTNNTDINAVAVFLSFPPEKLQVVSSTAGKSVVSLWSVPPRFNNREGTLELQGVITGGLNASNALITTITFRIKSTGTSIIKIGDASRVLRNDGAGTDYLQHRENSLYTLILPPPAGPFVVSETHPKQDQWYKDPNVSLAWSFPEEEAVDGYSYLINGLPVDIPDNISEGGSQSVVYQNISNGISYFHVKALRGGVWGGTTHFAVNIDTEAPAEFPLEINPSARTDEKRPVVLFGTTDALSGIDFYELKIVPITPGAARESPVAPDQPLFVEAQSPFVLHELAKGKYDVIVRAQDKAGNFQESVQRLTIRETFFGFGSYEGLEVDGWFVIPWPWILWFLVLLLAVLTYELLRLHLREKEYRGRYKEVSKLLPKETQRALQELKKYRERYGKISIVLLCAGCLLLGGAGDTFARELRVEPPLITTISRDISNEDIFYVGGKTNIPQSMVILYMQNLTTGESNSFEVASDEYGDWFYSHDTFLSSGSYVLWAQSKVGESVSPPSAREELYVQPTAVQFGSSRLSHNVIYQGLIIALMLLSGILGRMVFRMRERIKRRKERAMKEVREAEEAVRKGFAVLKRDIQQELEIIGKAKMERVLRAEEEKQEAQLLEDLVSIQRRIGKEIEDIAVLERGE